MAPTIQGKQQSREHERRQSSSSSRRSTTMRSDFVCQMKYNNMLPDIPFDAKFIAYPFESNRFVQYKATSLEKNYKHELLTDVDLGVNIDLIDPFSYAVDPNAVLDPADEKLLEEDPVTRPDQKRTRQHNKNVSWLRKTEYISTEYNRSQTSNEMAETKVGYSVKKKFQGTDLYKDRESQVAAIEGTFDAAKRPIHRHPSRPSVTPVEVLPVFPDFQMWAHPCAHVVFDTDPAPRGRMGPAQVEEMSQAMIRGMVDASGDQFVGYFLPDQTTMGKRKRDADSQTDFVEDEEYEYKMAREYNWNVKNKATKGYEENYFFVFREGEGVFYNELVTRVRLSKRRAKGGLGGVRSAISKLVVKHRELNDGEKRAQQVRMSQLDPTAVEEEEEEGEEGESNEGEAEDLNEKLFGDGEGSDLEDEEQDNKEAEDNQESGGENEENEEGEEEEEEGEKEEEEEKEGEDEEEDDEEEEDDDDDKESSEDEESSAAESGSDEED